MLAGHRPAPLPAREYGLPLDGAAEIPALRGLVEGAGEGEIELVGARVKLLVRRDVEPELVAERDGVGQVDVAHGICRAALEPVLDLRVHRLCRRAEELD